MFATLTIAGSGARRRPRPRAGAAARTIRRGDDRLLLAVLVAAQQLLAEVVVDRRVGAAPGRAGQRDGRDALPPSGARSSSGLAPTKAASRRAAAEAEAGRELLAQRAEDRGRVVGARRR